MRFLPFHQLTIVTPLLPEEVVTALRARVEPAPSMERVAAASPPPPTFEGEVRAGGFALHRVIRYRNAFLPILVGTLTPTPDGTRISVRLRPSAGSLAFMSLWAFGICMIGGRFVAERGPTLVSLGLPLFLLTAGYGMTMGGFWLEVRKSKALLVDTVGGREARSQDVLSVEDGDAHHEHS